jgi:protein-S-isoprenylcysteine O-methyltransferase Ste14
MRPERLFVWAGGALFAVSLVSVAFVYLVNWSRPPVAPGDRAIAMLVDAILLAVFACHHSVFARDPVKRLVARVVPERLLRSVYVWVASLLLVGVLALWRPVAGVLYHIQGWPAAVNAGVQLSGVWLIARAVAAIDPLELAGIRRARANDSLQVGGPYAWVRHPLYLGWMLALFGAANMTADRFTFAALTTLYLAVAVPWEERSLRRTFGEQYARYQRAVRWRMVPFVY